MERSPRRLLNALEMRRGWNFTAEVTEIMEFKVKKL